MLDNNEKDSIINNEKELDKANKENVNINEDIKQDIKNLDNDLIGTSVTKDCKEEITNQKAQNDLKDIDEQIEKAKKLKKFNNVSNKIMFVGGIIVLVLCVALLVKNLFFTSSLKKDTNVSFSSQSTTTTTTQKKDTDKITHAYAMPRLVNGGYVLESQNIGNKKLETTYKKDKYEATISQYLLGTYKAPFDTKSDKYKTGGFYDGEDQYYNVYYYKDYFYVIWKTNYYDFEIKTKNMSMDNTTSLVFYVEPLEQNNSSSSNSK